MNSKEFVSLLVSCSQQKSFAILKALQANKTMKYVKLLTYVGFARNDAAKFCYYLRKLRKSKVIGATNDSDYYLTERGHKIIQIIEENIKDKYIAEDPKEICSNSEDSIHEHIVVCRNCSTIIKVLEKKIVIS